MGLFFSRTTGRRKFKHSILPKMPGLNRRKRRYILNDPDFKKMRSGGFSRLERRRLRRKWTQGGKDPFSRRSAKKIVGRFKGL